MPIDSSHPSAAHPGMLLAGRYELTRRLGAGGMAEVWAANDTALTRPVAIKWLRANLAADPVSAERFRREAIACANLSHPNIVSIHDVVEHQGRQAVIMQLVDGQTLRATLDGHKMLGPELTIHVGAAMAGALDAAHKAGFVHRDVKPANILLTSDGRVLLTDFGIAKGLQSGDEDLTHDNVMMGTVKYLAPELVQGKQIDGRADLYSLALVLYECLAGRVPFLGESDADTALARLQRDPTDLAHLRPTLPIGLVNLIHRTLARNPKYRPQTGHDLRTALLAVDSEPPKIDPTPTEPPDRLVNPPQRALGAGPGVPGDPHLSGPVRSMRDHRPTRDRSGEVSSPNRAPVSSKRIGAPRLGPITDDTPPQSTPGRKRDITPAAAGNLHGRPARRDEQDQRRPAIVLAALAAAALVLIIVLILNNADGEPADDLTVSRDPATNPVTNDDNSVTSVAPAANDGPVSIATLSAYDPDGDNGTENNSQVDRASADGNPNTFWATECYQNQFLGGKSGVGLVVSLTQSSAGELSFMVGHSPYQVDVYTATGSTMPANLSGWQLVGATQFADVAGTVTTSIDQPVDFVLVWLKELGSDDACSGTNPYRGLLGEVSFVAS